MELREAKILLIEVGIRLRPLFSSLFWLKLRNNFCLLGDETKALNGLGCRRKTPKNLILLNVAKRDIFCSANKKQVIVLMRQKAHSLSLSIFLAPPVIYFQIRVVG